MTTKTTFGIRELRPDYWEVIATTPKGNCYRLGHAPCDAGSADEGTPAINSINDFTLLYVGWLWLTHRHDWMPDYQGGAGITRHLS